MKKLSFLVLVAFVFNILFMQAISFADEVIDKQLEQSVKDSEQVVKDQQTKELSEDFKFKTFNSCDDMEKVMTDFLSSYKNYYYRPMYYMMEDAVGAVNDLKSVDSAAGVARQEEADESVTSSTTDFSTTNVQVKGVDEPEIIKTDGKYIYYYNAKLAKIYIINSPLDISTAKIDLNKAQILKEITIPNNLSNIQLFLFNNRLVILATRYSEQTYYDTVLDKSTRTNVAIYDTSDIKNLKLLKLYDTYGRYTDARMINNQLYLVSQVDLRFYYAWQSRKVFGILENQTLDFDASDMMPKIMDISYTEDKSQQNVKSLPYNIESKKLDCKDIFYLMPTKESIEKYNVSPSFSIISKVDVDNYDSQVDTKTVFGNVAQMHMTDSALYLSNYFYVGYNFRCPVFARCIMPYYQSGENTLVHKFDLDSTKALSYVNSAIIPGSPLNQYSMSQDSEGYFRILTSTWAPQRATHLFILDKSLNLHGSLKDIEPGEDFKASRFMGNMLYLVTFQQIDPLFVIDISNKKSPKIIGELKMPGYSVYLHPYDDMKDGVQYIIGLGYDVQPTQWGGVSNAGIKLDLYKIDYNKKQTPEEKCSIYKTSADTKYPDCIAQFSGSSLTGSYVSVDQVKSLVIGDKGSWTEALENPRMFIFDNKRKFLIMPIILQKQDIQKVCSKDYLGKEYCYDNYNFTPTFAGLKGYTIDKTNGIIESISKDYKELIANASDYNNNYNTEWGFRMLNFRVGYLGDAIYGINNLFADFFLLGKPDTQKTIYLDETVDPKKCELNQPVCGEVYVQCLTYPCDPIKQTFKNRCELSKNQNARFISEGACESSSSSVSDEKQCTYTPPAPGEMTCEMYCGKRWVLGSENTCTEVEVNAACSCPGYDTKDSCEKSCVK